MTSKPSKDSLPPWSQFPIKDMKKGVDYSSAVLMGDYLVIAAHDCSYQQGNRGSDYDSDGDQPATLLAVNLRDNSVQRELIHDFYYQEDYSFNKYSENQIISFGGTAGRKALGNVDLITITSFEPFSFEVEGLENNQCGPKLRGHTAQIYNDCLYVYGGRNENFFAGPEEDLWCFDLVRGIWTQCQTSGEGPGPRARASSFIIQDNLYIYGGEGKSRDNNSGLKDIFVLNLSKFSYLIQNQNLPVGSMIWMKLKQEETYLQGRDTFRGTELNSDLYKGNLIIVGDGKRPDVLCCWNIDSNTWFTFDIQKKWIDLQNWKFGCLQKPPISLCCYR